MAWLIGLIFNGLVVPFYQFYSRATRNLSAGPSTGFSLNDIIAGRYTLPALILIVAGCLVYYNVNGQQAAVSSDDLVGKIRLAQLVSDNTGDFDQPIEEYPNLDLARWTAPKAKPVALLETSPTIYTKEQPTESPAAPATPGQVATRHETVSYKVQSGDTLGGIARRFGISVNTILWENNLNANALIKPGDTLSILPSSGVSHTVASGQTLGQIARLYGVESQAVMDANGITNPNQLRIGAKLVIPGGSKIATQTSTAKVAQDVTKGLTAIKKLINPGPSAVVPSGARMVWPTSGHNITQYYSWRHTGVDIANRIGTPIYAADDGTVTTAGWNNGGYGNQIIVTHAGGKTTRYAHLSAFSVNVGQKVKKGQYIGAMGSTGRSTGPHLHFEVMISGQRYNPLNYVR